MTAVFDYNTKSYIGDITETRGIHYDAETKTRIQTSGTLDMYDRVLVMDPGSVFTWKGRDYKILSAVTLKHSPMTRYQFKRVLRTNRA